MRKEYLFLILVIALAAFLRLWNLPSIPPGLYPDEAMNGNNALEALANNDWKVFYPENNGREGLFINIQSASLALFGNEPWALRLPSTIFGILTVLGIYLLTKELWRAKIFSSPKPPEASGLRGEEILALVAAFLLATSFWHINFSRIGFRAIMAPAFLTWGAYLLILTFNRNVIALSKLKNSKLIRSSKFEIRNLLLLPILAGVVYGLGMHSYIAYRATPLLILLIIAVYWLKNKDGEIRKRILLASFFMILASIIVFLPLGIYFFNNPADLFGRTTQISVFTSETPLKDLSLNTLKTLGMFNLAGDYNWRHNISGQPQLFWPVGIMFLAGLLIAIRHFIRDTRYLILLAWLTIAMLPVVISNEGLPHALRAIIMIPPVFILAGVGGVAIYNFFNFRTSDVPNITSISGHQMSRNLLLKTTSFSLLFYILLAVYHAYFIRWAKNPNTADAFAKNYVEIGRELNRLRPDQSKFVIVNAGGVDVRGLPMPTQTVMFITDTFREKERQRKNIHYLLPDEVEKTKIPPEAFVREL